MNDEVEELIYRLKYKNPNERIEIITELGNIGDKRATMPLLPQLTTKNLDLTIATLFALGKIRDPLAIPSLVALLDHKKEKVVKYAAQTLGKIQDANAIPGLVEKLASVKSTEAYYIIEALGEIQDKTATPYILEFLTKKKPEEELLAIAIKSLAKIRDPSTIDIIIPYLDNKHRNTRAFAAEALGISKNVLSIKKLVEHLSDPEEYVVEKAMESLESLNPAFKDKTREQIIQTVYKKVIQDVNSVDVSDPKELTQMIKKETDPEKIVHYIHLIGEAQYKPGVKILTKIKSDTSNSLILHAISLALKKMNYIPKDIEKYIQLFNEESIDKKLKAVEALRVMKNPQVFAVLFKYIQENHQNTDLNGIQLNLDIIDALSSYPIADTISFYEKIFSHCPIELYDCLTDLFKKSTHPIAQKLLDLPPRTDGRWGATLSLSDMGFKKAAREEEKAKKQEIKEQERQEKEEKKKEEEKERQKEQLKKEKEKEFQQKKKDEEKINKNSSKTP